MKTFTRREYNLVVKCLDYYETFMTNDDKKLAQIIQDKLYYFNVDRVTETNNNKVNVAALYDIKTEKIDENKITQDMVDASLNTPMWYEKNND